MDGVSIAAFEADLKNNLYKIWNRMSSGTYFPPPVRAVEIPKPHGGGTRILGIATVADRVAQTVAARRLEAIVEQVFPRRLLRLPPRALTAGRGRGACRQRCLESGLGRSTWTLAFFDTVPLALIRQGSQAATRPVPWVLLYVERWLTAPVKKADGTLAERTRGTPQGGPVSPLIANLFMHVCHEC